VAGGINPSNSTISNGTDTGVNTRSAYTAVGDMGLVSAVYLNAIVGHVGEFTPAQTGSNGNPVTLTAAIEYPAGNIIPLTFGGSISVTADYFAAVETDPANVYIPAGETYWIRTFATVTSGGFWQLSGRVADDASYTSSGGTGQSDLTQSGDITGTYDTPVMPVAIRALGISTATLRVAVFGDSITGGYQDATPVPAGQTGPGWAGRAFAGYRYVQNGLIGALIGDEDGTAAGMRALELGAARGANAGFAAYGTNDFAEGADAAVIEANLMMMYRQMSAQGMACYGVTLPPLTTTTDNWATTVNQAATGNEAVRVAFNQWMRAGMPVDSSTLAPVAVSTPDALTAGAAGHPVTRVYDLCGAVESSQDSGLWKATGTAYAYTADGTHPSPDGYAAMAAVIDVATILADVGATS
jgi:lysophospholipase L1-like esterase